MSPSVWFSLTIWVRCLLLDGLGWLFSPVVCLSSGGKFLLLVTWVVEGVLMVCVCVVEGGVTLGVQVGGGGGASRRGGCPAGGREGRSADRYTHGTGRGVKVVA